MKSNHWIRYAALKALKEKLDELMAEGHTDQVTLSPSEANKLINEGRSVIWPSGGNDTHSFSGVPATDIEIEAPLLIRIWARDKDGNVSLAIEELLARTRDKVLELVTDCTFRDLDPPTDIVSVNVIDDPSHDIQQDYSEVTLELVVRNYQ